MSDFLLDERLARDSECVSRIGLCQLRLMKDDRWPWLLLVPQRNGVSEIFELTPLDQTMLTFELNSVAAALKKVTGAEKVNIGAIGNSVRQLHVHIVARNEGDENWPRPVWGHGEGKPWDEGRKKEFIAQLLGAL